MVKIIGGPYDFDEISKNRILAKNFSPILNFRASFK